MESLKRFLLQSLRVRVLLLVSLVLLPVFALMIRTNAQERRIITQAAEENALRSSRVALAQQQQLVDGARQLLVALSQIPEVRFQEVGSCDRLFSRLMKEFPAYANLGVASPDGNVWCSAVPLAEKVSVADRSYFQQALSTHNFVAGNYQIGRVTGRPTLSFAQPVLDDQGQVRAVIFAGLDLRWLDREVAAMSLAPDSQVLVLDRTGQLLAHYAGQTSDPRSVPDSAALQRLAAQGNGIADITSPDGIKRVYGVATLDSSGIRVALGIPKYTIFADVDRLYRTNVLLIAGVLLLSLVAAWIGGNLFVMRPVVALRRAAGRLRHGELGARTGLQHGPGELNQLARSFDEMAGSLEARAVEQSALAHAAGAVVRELDLRAVANTVVSQAMDALRADQAALWLVRPDDRLELIAQCGFSSESAQSIAELQFHQESPAAQAAQTGRMIVLEDALDSDEFPDAETSAELGGPRGILAQPLSFRSRLVGVLSVCSHEPRTFSANELRLAATLGDLFAAAVENARLYEEAREALRLREEFLAAAAHELRTPSTVLASYAQLMARRGPHDELERRWLAAVQDATERAVRLSRELVEADRLARGANKINRTPLDLLELVRNRVAAIRLGPAHRRVWVCAAGPVLVEGDRRQLSLAIEGILENELKYQPARSALRVTLRAVGDEAIVEVHDSGPGIPPDRVAHVFEPLFEPWPPGSPHYVGVFGLGPRLARSIVEAHGGRIEIQSRLGEGSTFRIHLPQAAPRTRELEALRRMQPPTAESVAHG